MPAATNHRGSTVLRLLSRAVVAVSVFAFALLVATTVLAQEVGVVAGVEGTAEIGRNGKWLPAKNGEAVRLGDVLRTGNPGRLRVMFHDDSIITLGDETELEVTRKVFNPDQSTYRSLLKLIKGKVRTFVSEYYSAPKASYEVETRTAVAGVRGTEFVMVYDPGRKQTEVVGIKDRVEVRSTRDLGRRGVFVTTREITVVAEGAFPSAPRKIDDALFRQYLEGLQLMNPGGAESFAIQNPVATGELVPEFGQALTLGGPPPPVESQQPPAVNQPQSVINSPDASSLVGQPPALVETETSPAGEVGIEF